MEIGERIRVLLVHENVTQVQLSKDLNVSRSAVSQWLSKSNSLSLSAITALLNRFPNVNARWLITGVGSIYENKPYDYHEEIKNVVAEELSKYGIGHEKGGMCG